MGICSLCLQKVVEASLHALSARSELLPSNCEKKLRSREDPASYVRTASISATAAAENTGNRGHSLCLCVLRGGWHVFVSRRLPSSSPLSCRWCLDSPSLSGNDSLNWYLSKARLAQRAIMPTIDANMEHEANKEARTAPSLHFVGSIGVTGLWAAFAKRVAACKESKEFTVCKHLRFSARFPRHVDHATTQRRCTCANLPRRSLPLNCKHSLWLELLPL